ncbi:unnamed protein product, partial [Rotaria sp. Silwood1]
ESITGEKARFIKELEPITAINRPRVILTARIKHDLTSEFKR